ncbi:MAG: SemiSWEET transporter [Thermodesulfobacteriota bacterium]
MELITVIGLVAAVLTTVSFLPQAIRIIKLRETRDISLWTYILLEGGIVLWLIYGIMLGKMPIILANAITLFFTSVILFLKLKFG